MVKLIELSLKRRDNQQAQDAEPLEPKGAQLVTLLYPRGTRI
jgi:hypothetical protein